MVRRTQAREDLRIHLSNGGPLLKLAIKKPALRQAFHGYNIKLKTLKYLQPQFFIQHLRESFKA